jgi:hypothetical protein
MKKPNPNLAFAAPLDLLDPALGRLGAGHSAPQSTDVEIDRFAERSYVRTGFKSLIMSHDRAVCHGRSIGILR